MASEKRIQQEIRLELSPHATLFRANVGTSWNGDVVSHQGGTIVIANARPLRTGLPVGFSDLFGWRVIDGIARFVAIETKSPTGRATDEQERFLEFVTRSGGLAGIARSVADAKRIIGA